MRLLTNSLRWHELGQMSKKQLIRHTLELERLLNILVPMGQFRSLAQYTDELTQGHMEVFADQIRRFSEIRDRQEALHRLIEKVETLAVYSRGDLLISGLQGLAAAIAATVTELHIEYGVTFPQEDVDQIETRLRGIELVHEGDNGDYLRQVVRSSPCTLHIAMLDEAYQEIAARRGRHGGMLPELQYIGKRANELQRQTNCQYVAVSQMLITELCDDSHLSPDKAAALAILKPMADKKRGEYVAEVAKRYRRMYGV